MILRNKITENQLIKNIQPKNFNVRIKQSPDYQKPGFVAESLHTFLLCVFPEFRDESLRHRQLQQLP